LVTKNSDLKECNWFGGDSNYRTISMIFLINVCKEHIIFNMSVYPAFKK